MKVYLFCVSWRSQVLNDIYASFWTMKLSKLIIVLLCYERGLLIPCFYFRKSWWNPLKWPFILFVLKSRNILLFILIFEPVDETL